MGTEDEADFSPQSDMEKRFLSLSKFAAEQLLEPPKRQATAIYCTAPSRYCTVATVR